MSNTETSDLFNPETVMSVVMVENYDSASSYDIVIVGGGIAGLSAAIYSARAGWRTLLIEGTPDNDLDYPGGQLMLTDYVENYPGFFSGSGEELIAIVKAQAMKFGAKIIQERVGSIEFSTGGGNHLVVCENGKKFQARKIILATGSLVKKLGVRGEDEFYGAGIFSCVAGDGPLFIGKDIAVVGGGDMAVEDVHYLAHYANHIYLIHRRDTLKSSSPESRQIMDHPKVTILWNSVIDEIRGNQEGLNNIVIQSPEGVTSLDISALVVAIGRKPQSRLAFDGEMKLLDVKDSGYLLTWGTKTNLNGVFAAGDLVDSDYRQAVTAASSGVKAAIDATKELAEPLDSEILL